jgi:hypothetical protein
MMAASTVEMNLELAQRFAALRLPAALLPSVLGTAMQDFVDTVDTADANDLTALSRHARALGRNAVDDYVAATAAHGPLVPVNGVGSEPDAGPTRPRSHPAGTGRQRASATAQQAGPLKPPPPRPASPRPPLRLAPPTTPRHLSSSAPSASAYVRVTPCGGRRSVPVQSGPSDGRRFA